jgi:hypothetical protein
MVGGDRIWLVVIAYGWWCWHMVGGDGIYMLVVIAYGWWCWHMVGGAGIWLEVMACV